MNNFSPKLTNLNWVSYFCCETQIFFIFLISAQNNRVHHGISHIIYFVHLLPTSSLPKIFFCLIALCILSSILRDQAGLELLLPASNLSCIRIKGIYHHTWLELPDFLCLLTYRPIANQYRAL